jgi:glycosyltransferase involved in cell wall biosynthesis
MVTPRFPPLLGGVETHVYEVARRLAGHHDITVLTTDTTGGLPAATVVSDVEVRRFPAYPSGGDYYFSPALLRAVGSGGYDLVHVQGVHTFLAPLALRAARAAGVPSMLTFHTGGSSSPLRRAVRASQNVLSCGRRGRWSQCVSTRWNSSLPRSACHRSGSS